jgi:hypothetical protein
MHKILRVQVPFLMSVSYVMASAIYSLLIQRAICSILCCKTTTHMVSLRCVKIVSLVLRVLFNDALNC